MENAANKPSENKVGLQLDLTLVGLNGDQPLKAKIDTGAESCSLDAQNIEEDIDNVTGSGTVSFSLGEYKYKMAIAGHQAITSADGGTKNRPTIKVGVRINDQYIPDVVFNLSDRSNMDYPILVGVNLIQAAKLVVDSSITEAGIEITFADDPEQKVQNMDQVSPVEVADKIQDNTSSGFDIDAFVMWLEANKTKTIGQFLAELIQSESTKDAKE